MTTTDLYGLYATVSGTSVAVPHAAGALALLLSAYPDLDADRQSAALQHAADLAPAGIDDDSGYGRLDALSAYQWLAAAPDFTLSATPASRTCLVGATTTYTATVGAMNGFATPVTPSVTGLPTGATAAWSPASVTGSGATTLTVAAPTGVAPGSYPLTITGAGGTLTHSSQVTLVLTQSDFALTAAPSTLSVTRGGSVSTTVGTTGAGTVTLSVTGLPSNSTGSFTANPVVVPGTSRLTIRTTSAGARGTFTVRVIGVAGPLTHTTQVTLTVR